MITSLILAAVFASSCDGSRLVVQSEGVTMSWDGGVTGPFYGSVYTVHGPCALADTVFTASFDGGQMIEVTVYFNNSHDGYLTPSGQLGPMTCSRWIKSDGTTVLDCGP